MKKTMIAAMVFASAGITATNTLAQGAAADYPQRPIHDEIESALKRE